MSLQKEFLKNEISKRFENFGQQGSNTEIEIFRFFRIPVDESRVQDYKITKVNIDDLSIEVFDTKTGTTFTSCFSKDSEVLGHFVYVEEIEFINVSSKSPLCERGAVYHIDNDKPILEKMTIYDGIHELFFKRTMPNVIDIFYRQDGTKFLVTYSENQGERNFDLSTSTYKTGYTIKNIDSFERTFIQDNELTWDKDRPDHFIFIIEGNVIAGTKLKNDTFFIDGACFEDIDAKSLTETLMNNPFDKVKDYSSFDTSLAQSAILYAGYESCKKKKTSYYHDLEVVKTEAGISITYRIIDKAYYPHPRTKVNKSFVIPSLCSGKISLEEVDNLIAEFQKRFKKDAFIKFVIDELLTFKEKLKIKKGLSQEVLSPLSPKLLFDKTFDEILDEVISEKESYFNLAAKQFESMIHGVKPTGKGQPKILKPKDQKK